MNTSPKTNPETCSIEELDALAVELAKQYNNAELALKIHHWFPREENYKSATAAPDLDDVLRERKCRLNSEFKFTPETLARFIKISDLMTACIKKAWLEAKPERDALEQRLQRGDTFLHDYELELKIIPYTNKEGVYEVLEDSIHGSTVDLTRYAKHYEECGSELDSREDCDEHRGNHGELMGQRIGYAMHELYDHTYWSVPDILKIETIWVDVVITRQHFHEKV